MKIPFPPVRNELIDGSKLLTSIFVKWFNEFISYVNRHFTTNGDVVLTVYSQDDIPTLAEVGATAIWIDTNDSNKVYLIYRQSDSTTVKVQLT